MLKPVYMTLRVRKLTHYAGACEVCGSDFIAQRSDALTCSERCRQIKSRFRRRAKLKGKK